MASADWQSKILKKEYQNWLAVGHALSLMLDGLRPYVEREIKAFHQALLANLATVPRCTCPTLTNHTCAWAAELVRCHRGGRRGSPKWRQSDSSAWTDPHRGEWEVAKLFMSDLGTSKTTVVDANTTDCTGLINLMFWCVHFPIQRHVIEAVRETRNTWAHDPRQELTDSERADALTAIRDLLQDPELIADGDAKTALNEITLMEANFDAQSVQRKVLADFQVAVLGQLGDIEGELRNVNRCCKEQQNNSNKIRKKLRGLENRQKKATELLQRINDRIEDEERRNIPFTSKTWKAIAWTLKKTERAFVVNLCSLSTRSLLFWTFLIILLGCFKCLDHNSYNDGCPLEVGDVPFDTKEFNFTRYLNKSREHFTGRRWLYSELESILSDSQGNIVRGVVVIGKPGVGKSALSAQLICSRASSPYIHKTIIGYHLCKYSDKATQDPGLFVRNLVDLIARRIPEYGMLIYNSSFIPRVLQTSCLRDPYDCFEQAIAIPLRQVQNERQYHFIIIDALDECASDSAGTSLIQFLKDTYNRLPKWVRLVMTSRNDFAVLNHFDSFPKVHLSSSDARNWQDIEIFIASKLLEDTPFLERAKVILGLGSSDEVTYLTNKLLTQSEGNFLFAKLMLQYGKDDWHNKADLNKLPKTVGEQYERYLRRAYGSREKFKPALAILEILAATFEPLTAKNIFDVLRIQEKMDFEYDFVYALKGLSHFVPYGEDNTIIFFHQTFREWLTSEDNLGSPYYVSKGRGHRRLVEYYINVLRNNPNSSMDIYRLAQHISFGEEADNYLDEFRNINASYINATIDNDKRTLLHLSASKNNRKALRILSEAFEEIDCEDSHGFTPAFVAAMNGLAENVDFLLSKGANIEHRTKAPPSPSYVWGNPIERSKTSFWNSTMMHAAASGGHIDVVRLLLRNNASFTGVNGVNLTTIQLAAQNGHLEVVQLLHEHGVQLDHLSLQYAAFEGHENVVAYLLKFGVEDICMPCDESFYWLQNRTRYQAAVKGELSQFVDEMVITSSMVKHICETPVTEQAFIEQLHELHHKIDFAKEQSFKGALSVNDVGNDLEKLKVKAVQKIRNYVMEEIYQFRRPMTNYQIPQNALLKYRYFNQFLMAHHCQVAREIRDEYIDTMSKIYFSYFKTYISKLLKLQFEESADRDDLMGVDDNAKRGIFSAKIALKNRSTIFTLGSRGNVLTSELEEPVIVPHAAQKTEKKYSFESLFRSMHFALLDNSCREYLFLAGFFMAQNNAAKDLFTAVFGKTLSLFLKQMDTNLESCFDAIDIFLCIHIVHRYRILMHKRSVPALDKYWDTVLEMSWRRFTYVVELNVDSVRNTDPQKLGVIDIGPHYITRRYAEFSAAIVSLNESFPDEKVNKVLAALQVEVENFILRMAAEFPLRKEQLIFLINNYDMMLAVLMERTSEDSKEAEGFQQLLTARIQEFVEEVLSPAFGGMTAFIKETEPLLERGQGQVIRPDERRIQQLVRGFASDWKRSIENINQEIMRSFSNFKNGTAILQAALTQLIQYYHRFQKILRQHPFKRLPIRSELINIRHVMIEVKKHKTTF